MTSIKVTKRSFLPEIWRSLGVKIERTCF